MQEMFFNIIGWEKTEFKKPPQIPKKTKKEPTHVIHLETKVVILFLAEQLPVAIASIASILTESVYNFHQQLLDKAKDLTNYYAIQRIKLWIMLLILWSFNSIDCIFHQMCFFLGKILCP